MYVSSSALLGLEREPLARHTPIPRMSYHHTQQDAMQQHAPHLEGLELEALVLFGEVIEVHLNQLVRHMVDMRPPARRRDAVDERHLCITIYMYICMYVCICLSMYVYIHT